MDKKVYEAVLSGKSDNNIKYTDLKDLIIALGFDHKRQKGSHTMYYNDTVNEFMNIQKDGSKAKGYQVEQLRNIIIKHGL